MVAAVYMVQYVVFRYLVRGDLFLKKADVVTASSNVIKRSKF
jgi:hypothetical protein